MVREFFRSRPALFVATAMGLGIAFAAQNIGQFPNILLSSTGIIILLTWRATSIKLYFLYAAFVLLGHQLTSLEIRNYTDTNISRIASMKPAKVVLTGTIQEIDEATSEYHWILQTDSIAIPEQSAIPVHGTVLLRISKSGYSRVPLPPQGSNIRVYSSLEPFHRPTNPHEFASDLKLQTTTQTEAEGFVHSRFDYYILSSPRSSLLSRTSDEIASIHASLLALLDKAILDVNVRGFVEAVVLGDRNDMDKETLNDFTTAGVAHILAVSGFNVAIVSLVVAQLLRIFGMYWRRTRIGITMTMVLMYSAIVGFQPSVVRALLMIELYLFAELLERKPDPLNIVMSAAAINLLFGPQDLFDVGFQLSYAGVLGMILIAPKILWFFRITEDNDVSQLPNDKHLFHHRWIKEVASATALSIGASIASYPVIAAHFYRISFIGLLANLPLIPLSAIITAYGFLILPIAAVSQYAGQLYGEATSYMTNLLLFLTHISAHMPSAARAAASPSWIFLSALAISLIFCLRSKTRPQFLGRITIVLSGFFALWVVEVPFSNSVLDKNPGSLQVLYFDVGQGDCILLQTPSQRSYFIDFGKMGVEGTPVIERTAIPFLRAENITSIDAGFISHMHADHYGGASALLKNSRVHSLMSSGERINSSLARSLDSLAQKQHIVCRRLARGDTMHLDSEVMLYVLHPKPQDRALETDYAQDIHKGMLVFKVVYRNTSFLFLGDVERSQEEEILIDYRIFLKSSVVKVAHHGSYSSSSKEFVGATDPEYAVISVGEHNTFGHPSPAIVKRWRMNNADVLRTDNDGAILLTSDGNEVNRVFW